MKITKIYEWQPYQHESKEKEIPKGWNVVCELVRDEKITCGRCGRTLKGHESEQSIFLSDGAGKSVLICKECQKVEKKEATEAKKRKWNKINFFLKNACNIYNNVVVYRHKINKQKEEHQYDELRRV